MGVIECIRQLFCQSLPAAAGRAVPSTTRLEKVDGKTGGQMLTRRLSIAIMLLAAGVLSNAGSAVAEDFPSRPVNLIVHAPAGGATDVGARILGSIAEKILGQPIVILNRGGAGGQIAWTELAAAKPDGYTIGYVVTPGVNMVVLDPDRKATFAIDSFIPIVNQVLDPGIIWVRASSPFKSYSDLIAAARAAPRTVRASTTGLMSDDHLNIIMTEEANPGVFFRLVHFDGSVAQVKETLAGNVDVSFDNIGGTNAVIKSGQARGLAVTDTVRSKFLPDVPTTVELGYPTLISSSTRGIFAPKGTPKPVIAKLADALSKAMANPEHTAKLEAQGLTVRVMQGEEYERYYREAHESAKKYYEMAKSRAP
jgi:tripartite-type tricarboxylate transporter receptor subunit TctC